MDDLFSEFFKKNSKTFRYRKGEFIIRPDFPPSGIFYIEKGFVRVYFLTGDGEEKLYIIYKEDEIFPIGSAGVINKSIGGSSLIIVDGSHDWIFFKTDEFLKLFEEWLNKKY